MRPYVLLVVIGIIVAGLAAIAVRNAAPPPEVQQAAAARPTARILVAQENIAAGSFVRDTQIAWGDWPVEQAKAPYVVESSGTTAASFNGAVARRTILAGEPITASSMVKPGEGGFMSAVLTPGERAVSIPVNPTTGNAGFIFPGDLVDLILTHTIQRDNTSTFASETFVENVRVLAVDQMLDNPENKAVLAKTVTLEVSPKEAEAITVAMEMGKISLSLRSLAADNPQTPAEGTQPVTLSDETPGAELPSPAANAAASAKSPGIDYFYPDESSAGEKRHYTRDSDISRLLGSSSGNSSRVRVIRGRESTDIDFPRSDK